MIVVADASPIWYLLLIGYVDLLQRLFGQVVIPQAVHDELSAEGAPTIVRTWIEHPPSWLQIQYATTTPDASLGRLHLGECEAITLAAQLKAALIVLDDKAARRVAVERGLHTTGLLGILDEAATRRLIDLPTAIERLQRTTFRASPRLLKALLDRHQGTP
jgi:predicted nucleic acid-binding protein